MDHKALLQRASKYMASKLEGLDENGIYALFGVSPADITPQVVAAVNHEFPFIKEGDDLAAMNKQGTPATVMQ